MLRKHGADRTLECDRCGLTIVPPGRPALIVDDAKAYGWTRRRRFQATRDYCPACSQSIEAFAEGRKGRR